MQRLAIQIRNQSHRKKSVKHKLRRLNQSSNEKTCVTCIKKIRRSNSVLLTDKEIYEIRKRGTREATRQLSPAMHIPPPKLIVTNAII